MNVSSKILLSMTAIPVVISLVVNSPAYKERKQKEYLASPAYAALIAEQKKQEQDRERQQDEYWKAVKQNEERAAMRKLEEYEEKVRKESCRRGLLSVYECIE